MKNYIMYTFENILRTRFIFLSQSLIKKKKREVLLNSFIFDEKVYCGYYTAYCIN